MAVSSGRTVSAESREVVRVDKSAGSELSIVEGGCVANLFDGLNLRLSKKKPLGFASDCSEAFA